jgi:hypothetical protein
MKNIDLLHLIYGGELREVIDDEILLGFWWYLEPKYLNLRVEWKEALWRSE